MEGFEALLTRQDVAELLKVSLRKVDYLMSAGKLSAIRVERAVRFAPEELRRYIADNTSRSGRGIL